MQEIFKNGEYYIGSPELVLDYEGLEALGSFGGICEIAGQKCASFECSSSSATDSSGFVYSIENTLLALLPAALVNEEVLKQKILTIKNGVLYNKFSGFKLARIVKFDSEFSVEFKENELRIAELDFKI